MGWSLATRLMAAIEGRQEDLESEPPPSSIQPVALPVFPCACNTCGRAFPETWVWFGCPTKCGGTIRMV